MANQFSDLLGLKKDQSPFPWQIRLFEQLCVGLSENLILDIPTGLGKTSVMAAWLAAIVNGATLPRRLIYIVDRRAVVDQATDEAINLRKRIDELPLLKKKIGLEDGISLPVSTLRGQFADNRSWLVDPTVPAIVVGTVDMVGSRLLFNGYSVSRKMRPYHAGFLGSDCLFVLDESHLVPPFESLLNTVVDTRNELYSQGYRESSIPRSRLISLSATGRNSESNTLQIDDDDLKHPVAKNRLFAIKNLSFDIPQKDDKRKLPERVAAEAWRLTDDGALPLKIVVFCNSRKDAADAQKEIHKLAKAGKKAGKPKREIADQLFVGARRVRERQQVAEWLSKSGFLAGGDIEPQLPTFVFATSAGEVGVDLDAHHMVGDLVAWERMVQRFGRVNRRGKTPAVIKIMLEKVSAKASSDNLYATYQLPIKALQVSEDGHGFDVSPEAIRQLKIQSQANDKLKSAIRAATSPIPLRPELTRPILESWAMTSLEKNPGSPEIAPWLRGWGDENPQTSVVWRKYLPTESAYCTNTQITEFFEAAPIHLSEKLETDSNLVLDWLLKRVAKLNSAVRDEKLVAKAKPLSFPSKETVVAIVFDSLGKVLDRKTLGQLTFDKGKIGKRKKEDFRRKILNNILVLDWRVGGLDEGLLDNGASADSFPTTIDGQEQWMDGAVNDEAPTDPIPAFKIFSTDFGEEPTFGRNWRSQLMYPIYEGANEEPIRHLTILKFRKTVTSEASRSFGSEQTLESHHSDTEREATRFAERLQLSPEQTLMLQVSARNHDFGKDCDRWQTAFSANLDNRPYAKTKGPLNVHLLGGYRHEFGSLPRLILDPDFKRLSSELQDLAMHLVASHHGFGRPNIRVDGCEDVPPSKLEQRAQDVAIRYCRLQKHWGPWGLAWWESILRAADHSASRLAEDRAVETQLGVKCK